MAYLEEPERYLQVVDRFLENVEARRAAGLERDSENGTAT